MISQGILWNSASQPYGKYELQGHLKNAESDKMQNLIQDQASKSPMLVVLETHVDQQSLTAPVAFLLWLSLNLLFYVTVPTDRTQTSGILSHPCGSTQLELDKAVPVPWKEEGVGEEKGRFSARALYGQSFPP